MIRIEKFIFNLFSENTYLIWDEDSREAMVIDPGCYHPEEEETLNSFIEAGPLKVKYLINTHCHIDHILGNAFVAEKYKPLFLAAEEDLFLLDLMYQQAEQFGYNMKKSPAPSEYLTEKSNIQLGRNVFKPLFTPGHSPGGYCLLSEASEICITGDVLFYQSIGRTDLWGGNYDTLIRSIESKLLILPDNVIVYPGHGESTTIGGEKQHNPFL